VPRRAANFTTGILTGGLGRISPSLLLILNRKEIALAGLFWQIDCHSDLETPAFMKRTGINYDVGIYPFGEARPSRAVSIRNRPSRNRDHQERSAIAMPSASPGRDLERLVTAAGFALDQGLEVWSDPPFTTRTKQHTARLFHHMRQGGRTLRQKSRHIVFIADGN